MTLTSGGEGRAVCAGTGRGRGNRRWRRDERSGATRKAEQTIRLHCVLGAGPLQVAPSSSSSSWGCRVAVGGISILIEWMADG